MLDLLYPGIVAVSTVAWLYTVKETERDKSIALVKNKRKVLGVFLAVAVMSSICCWNVGPGCGFRSKRGFDRFHSDSWG